MPMVYIHVDTIWHHVTLISDANLHGKYVLFQQMGRGQGEVGG